MKNLTKTLLVSIAVALAYPAFAAGTASTPDARPMRQAKPDMTKAEHMKAVEERFNAMDSNKDGKITAEERAAKRPGRGMGPGASAPAVETKADMLKKAEARFAEMDKNKDGKITSDERGSRRGDKAGKKHGGKHGQKANGKGNKGGQGKNRGQRGVDASSPTSE